MKADVYNAQGKKSGSVELPESIFGVEWNDALMHQVVTSMQDNARPTVAHVKDRGEVRGGGKKPWQQKGTGRARHGSIRSPIWVGGGVTHGPRSDKDYSRTIPRKMRAKALFMALSRKLKDGELVLVDSFGITEPKTAAAKKALVALSKAGFEKLSSKKKNAATVALSDAQEASKKSFRNIGNVHCLAMRDLNPLAVLSATYLVIENPEAAIKIVEHKLAAKAATGEKPVAKKTAAKKSAKKSE